MPWHVPRRRLRCHEGIRRLSRCTSVLLYYCTIIHGHFIVISWFWAVFYMVIPLYYIVLLYHMPIGFDQMSWGNTAQILCDKQLEYLGFHLGKAPATWKHLRRKTLTPLKTRMKSHEKMCGSWTRGTLPLKKNGSLSFQYQHQTHTVILGSPSLWNIQKGVAVRGLGF